MTKAVDLGRKATKQTNKTKPTNTKGNNNVLKQLKFCFDLSVVVYRAAACACKS